MEIFVTWSVLGSIRYRVVPRWLGTQIDPNPEVAAPGASPGFVGIDFNTPFGRWTDAGCTGAAEVGTGPS
jgi:hypothetical protein